VSLFVSLAKSFGIGLAQGLWSSGFIVNPDGAAGVAAKAMSAASACDDYNYE